MADLDRTTFEGIVDLVLEVPYPNNHVRMIVNDTLPWTADQALAFHGWSDEKIITFHIDILGKKIDDCIGVAASEAFRLRHPGTAKDNIRLVLRLRHLPVPGAEAFLTLIEKRVKSEEMQFLYGYGGDGM
ncbi:hypothetical protein [Rhizobium ecuadorense]|uniref:hypothetical protein n=1 Tax=Rhizobium ecuadorense TaxID=1671795 RepID=UPI000673334A|nr:hypothetical protein [Rhizobium ecuadorense]